MAYFDPNTAEPQQDFYVEVAGYWRERLAPVPTPEPADFAEKAERAERLLYDYLSSTQGATLSSVSAVAGSLSFLDVSNIKGIVKVVMGDYYTAGSMKSSLIRRG